MFVLSSGRDVRHRAGRVGLSSSRVGGIKQYGTPGGIVLRESGLHSRAGLGGVVLSMGRVGVNNRGRPMRDRLWYGSSGGRTIEWVGIWSFSVRVGWDETIGQVGRFVRVVRNRVGVC